MFFYSSLLALDINEETTHTELLSHSQIYIDFNKSATIENIKNKNFKTNGEKVLGFGYSPDLYVWIKFTLTNTSNKTLPKIIEYGNPLTSCIELYDGKTKKLLNKDGLLSLRENRKSINPNFKIILKANESKIFYIKAYSNITTLIVKLDLWGYDTFYKKEIPYQLILALFFGAMGIIIIYNFIIYLSTRDKSYLYYVLSFMGITFYYLLYKGVASLYLIPPEVLTQLIGFSSFIVAIPVFFLALFTKSVLELNQYPRINSILHYALIAFPFLTLFSYLFHLDTYRSFFPILLLTYLIFITFYTLLKHNRQAKFIMVGWLVFFTSALFMYLSSLGVYDIFTSYPHYTEFTLIAEAIAFSYSLADKIKQLHKENLAGKNDFILYQEEETNRLSLIVTEKTSELTKSLNEKKLLLRELNHRVKNSMQTIISFLRLQRYESKDEATQDLLKNLENKVFAINDLYALLHTSENVSIVNAHKYFSLLISTVRESFQQSHIDIRLNTDISISSDDAVYCGFILNEAITNSYQHAFSHRDSGEISISLRKENDIFHFTIKDNGIGYTAPTKNNTLGMMIIDTLAKLQLNGSIHIDASNGVEINILWKAHA